uniref:Uncharacterized protein n=1 Tax=Romanomermis culicivorax TaxID=13658 RepID=A0A915HG85_ROMCU
MKGRYLISSDRFGQTESVKSFKRYWTIFSSYLIPSRQLTCRLSFSDKPPCFIRRGSELKKKFCTNRSVLLFEAFLGSTVNVLNPLLSPNTPKRTSGIRYLLFVMVVEKTASQKPISFS